MIGRRGQAVQQAPEGDQGEQPFGEQRVLAHANVRTAPVKLCDAPALAQRVIPLPIEIDGRDQRNAEAEREPGSRAYHQKRQPEHQEAMCAKAYPVRRESHEGRRHMRITQQPGIGEQDEGERCRLKRDQPARQKRDKRQSADQQEIEIAAAKPSRRRYGHGIGDKCHVGNPLDVAGILGRMA